MIEHEGVTMCQPGDDDLSMEITGARIQAISEIDRSFIVHLTGGIGWWLDEDGAPLDVEHVTETEITVTCGDENGALRLGARLRRWHRTATPLTLAASVTPGRLGYIGSTDDPGDWWPMPTQGYPSDEVTR